MTILLAFQSSATKLTDTTSGQTLFLWLPFSLPFDPPVDGVEVLHTLTRFVRSTFWGNMKVLSANHP